MAFHRFRTATYFGGMPTGYDLINVVSGGIGASGSAFADGRKTGSSENVGTYFLAWGEDATTANGNRGFRALSENTDALDDLMRRDLAVTLRTNDVVTSSPVTSVALPANTFLGVPGTTNNPAGLAALFEVTDSNDDEIVDPTSNARCRVILAALGTGDQIGGGGSNGAFSGNAVTVTVNPAIPAGKTYRIYYATRTNLATMPVDTFTNIIIRGAAEAAAGLEQYKNSLASQVSSLEGALLIGMKALPNWANGDTNGAGTLSALFAKVVTDLAARATSLNEGADRVGFFPSGNILATTVGDAIRELDVEKAALAGASFVGDVSAPAFRPPTTTIERVQRSHVRNEITGTVMNAGFAVVGADELLFQSVEAPHGSIVSAVSIYIDPLNRGSLPTSKVKLEFRKGNVRGGSGSGTISGTIEDPASTTSAYEAKHSFSATGLNEVIDNVNFLYYVFITGESGGVAASVQVTSCIVATSPGPLDPGK